MDKFHPEALVGHFRWYRIYLTTSKAMYITKSVYVVPW